MMKLSLKNRHEEALKIYIEPSTDILTLPSQSLLTVVARFPGEADFELEYGVGFVKIWIPTDQTADFFIDGVPIETLCSEFVW